MAPWTHLEGAVSVDAQGQSGPEIENRLAEKRAFPPDPVVAAQANVTAGRYDEATRIPGGDKVVYVTALADATVMDIIGSNTGKAEEE